MSAIKIFENRVVYTGKELAECIYRVERETKEVNNTNVIHILGVLKK